MSAIVSRCLGCVRGSRPPLWAPSWLCQLVYSRTGKVYWSINVRSAVMYVEISFVILNNVVWSTKLYRVYLLTR